MDNNYTVSATVMNGYNTPLQMEVKAKNLGRGDPKSLR